MILTQCVIGKGKVTVIAIILLITYFVLDVVLSALHVIYKQNMVSSHAAARETTLSHTLPPIRNKMVGTVNARDVMRVTESPQNRAHVLWLTCPCY